MQRLLVLVATGVLAIGLAACGSSSKSNSSSGGSESAQITIDSGFAFHTSSVTAGSTVTVRNDSSTEHTVTADDNSFNVSIAGGKTATFTAPKAGSYKFHCNIHSFMKGTLTVT